MRSIQGTGRRATLQAHKPTPMRFVMGLAGWSRLATCIEPTLINFVFYQNLPPERKVWGSTRVWAWDGPVIGLVTRLIIAIAVMASALDVFRLL